MRCVPRPAVRGVATQNTFHLILQLELDFLQPDFFELFGFCEVVSSCCECGEGVNLFVEIVMTGDQLAVLFAAVQQLTLYLFEVVRRFRPQ